MSQLFSFFAIPKADLNEAKEHLGIALEMFDVLPASHEELIEKLREYFSKEKCEVFSRIIAEVGESDFREFISEAVVETGKYKRCDDGQIYPVA